jgi:hypothetical protein
MPGDPHPKHPIAALIERADRAIEAEDFDTLIDLIGARGELAVGPAGLTGRIGGGIPEAQARDLLDALGLELVARLLAEDCPAATPPACNCTEGSQGESFLELFDQNEDCAISAFELDFCTIAGCGAAPPADLDLLDADGSFRPRADGVRDSLSFAVEQAVRSRSRDRPRPRRCAPRRPPRPPRPSTGHGPGRSRRNRPP